MSRVAGQSFDPSQSRAVANRLRTIGRDAGYDEGAGRRIRFIKQAQQCGFTLAEIRELLALRGRSTARCGDVRQRAITKKLQLDEKIRSMKAMSNALDRLISDCTNASRPIEECTILVGLEQAEAIARVS